MSSHIDVPLLNLALDYVLFPALKGVPRDSFDVVRFTSDGKRLIVDATDGSRTWGAEIEAELPEFRCLVSVEDCKGIKCILTDCRVLRWDNHNHRWLAITIEVSGEVLSFVLPEGEKIEIQPAKKGSSSFRPLDNTLATGIESLNPSHNPDESARRTRIACVLLAHQEEIIEIVEGSPEIARVPDEFLIVVHHRGEPMSKPRSGGAPSKNINQMKGFSDKFPRWLEDKAKEMPDATVSDLARSLRSDSPHRVRFCVFESLRDFAEWNAKPEYAAYRGFFSHFVMDSVPIYVIDEFVD